MTTVTVPERRRAPRMTCDAGSWLAVPATWPVQLLDVGLGGVAFTSPYRLEIGRSVSVRAPLGRDALNAQVTVCWTRERKGVGPTQARYEVGASFVPLDESSRRALEAFLKSSSK